MLNAPQTTNRNDSESGRRISVILPAYNEEGAIMPIYSRLSATLVSLGMDYEIIFVNDGSTDKTVSRIEEIHEVDARGLCDGIYL